ncbi:MAG: NUDIX hydrolase [Candidatus Moranbacteria bacterium]|jgi:8-oxo-dGTP pyrophosphatase MutT (NUDIX family)|nr:NUDIX hydrolase [Candidatus Moranbacteria bacterium]
MIYSHKPIGFTADLMAVGCFVEYLGRILLIFRSGKIYSNVWGLPSGKVEEGESFLDAAVREVEEEVGIALDPGTLEKVCDDLFIEFKDGNKFIYGLYRAVLTEKPIVNLQREAASGYCWAFPRDVLCWSLIEDLDECIRIAYP